MSVLSPQDLEEIQPYLEERHYAPGDLILQQGARMGTFHIIVSGRVDVFVEGERRVKVATLEPGTFIGEMSTLTGNPVNATVEAAEPVVTLSVDQEGLLNLIDVSKTLRHRLVGGLISRVNSSNTRVQEENMRSAIFAQAMSRSKAERFGELLGEGVAQVKAEIRRLAPLQTPVLVLGETGAGKQHVAARLHYESPRRDHPIVFLDGRAFDLEEWRRDCHAAAGGTVVLIRADLIAHDIAMRAIAMAGEARLVVTAADFEPPPGFEVIRLSPLRELQTDVPTLVRHFLLDAGVKSPESALNGEALRYLVAFPYMSGNIKELEKAVREAVVLAQGEQIRQEHLRLGSYRPPGSRPRIGLALGGGAVRGGAHVGVLRVLQEEGIPIDMVAGTSAGAMAGVLFAAGVEVDMIGRMLLTTKFGDMFKWTMPKISLWDNTPMRRNLEKFLGGPLQFSDLKLPFAAVACDALTGQPVVIQSGLASSAVQASAAIPMLVRPVEREGRLLVDGGVVQNVPAMVVRSMGADLVIAVNVSVPGFGSGPPKNLFEALLNAFDMTRERLAITELEWADVVIQPQFGALGQDLKNVPKFIKLGEEAAHEAVPVIRRRMQYLVEKMA